MIFSCYFVMFLIFFAIFAINNEETMDGTLKFKEVEKRDVKNDTDQFSDG
jgi:hypothetical protein